MLDLWKKAGWGMKKQEQGAWIMRDPTTGQYSCKAWPQTNEEFKLTLKKGTPIPDNTVAIIHTHPAPTFGKTQQPDDAGDRKVAQVLGYPIYTITKNNGVGKYDPATDLPSKEETSIVFPNAARDGCTCKK